MACRSNSGHRLLVAYILRDIRRVTWSSVEDLLRLILPRFSFSNFLLLLNGDMACPCCMALVLATKKAVQVLGLIAKPSTTKTSSSTTSRSWWSERSLLHARSLRTMMAMLSIVGPIIVGTGVVDWSDMPRVKYSSEAPSHLRKHVGLLPSLVKIIVSPNVLIHLLKKLFQSLWRLPRKILSCRFGPKPLDHGLNDNLIGQCGRLCS
jgi:hypothetical protein